MPWNLQSHDYPILTPGQMNPFNQALSSGLDTYQNMVKSAYAPSLTASEIASKNAYAQNVGRQSLSSVLSNPLAVSQMTPENFNALIQQLKSGGTIAQPQESTGAASVWDKLKNWTGLTPDTSGTNTNQGGNSSSSMPAQTNGSNAYNYDSQGNNVKASPEEVQQIANNGNGSVQNSPSNVPQGTLTTTPGDQGQNLKDAYIAKNFPGTSQGIEATKRIEAAKKQAEVETPAYQKYKTDTYTSALSAQRALNDLNDFHSNYSNAFAKGPFTKIPIVQALSQLDPNYQKSINDSNSLVLDLAPSLLAGGKQTDYGKKLVSAAKIDPTLSPSAEQGVYNKQKLIISRIAEQAPFINELEKYGIKDVNQQQADFLQYNLKNKLVADNGKLQPNNLNTYKQFLSDKYGGKSQPQNNNSQRNDFAVEGKEPPSNTIIMLRPDGQNVYVHKNNVQLAKDKYKFKEVE